MPVQPTRNLKKLQTDLQACQQYRISYMCQGRYTTRTHFEVTCLGAYYLKNWPAVNKLFQLHFIPAKEHIFKMSSNKWIISSLSSFSTQIQCNKVFSTIKLKSLSLVTVPAGCSMAKQAPQNACYSSWIQYL